MSPNCEPIRGKRNDARETVTGGRVLRDDQLAIKPVNRGEKKEPRSYNGDVRKGGIESRREYRLPGSPRVVAGELSVIRDNYRCPSATKDASRRGRGFLLEGPHAQTIQRKTVQGGLKIY